MNNEDPLTNSPIPEEPLPQQAQPTPETPIQPAPLQPSIPQTPIATQGPAIYSQPPIEQQPQPIGVSPAPTSNTRSFKPFILGGAGLALVVILGFLGAILYLPHQADYNEAIDTYNGVVDANNKLVTDLDSITTGDTPETKTKIEKDYKSYKVAFAKLEGLKALRDGETNKSYASFSKKNDEFTKYFDGILASYDDMMKVSEDCSSDVSSALEQASDINQIIPTYDKAVEPCKDALERLQASDNELIASYGKDSISFLNDVRTSVQDMVDAASTGNQTAYLAAEGEYTQLVDDFTATAAKFEKEMKKEGDDKSVNDTAHDFKDVLEKKAKDSTF